jgi:hypothetical protein
MNELRLAGMSAECTRWACNVGCLWGGVRTQQSVITPLSRLGRFDNLSIAPALW